jgi:NDP-sugar pyrophosphorylase family protein
MVSKAVLIAPTDGGPRDRNGGSPRLSASDATPLALVPIANRPLLFHALDALEEAGIQEVALVAPHGCEPELRHELGDREWGLELEWFERGSSETLAG